LDTTEEADLSIPATDPARCLDGQVIYDFITGMKLTMGQWILYRDYGVFNNSGGRWVAGRLRANERAKIMITAKDKRVVGDLEP
jgi:hypothetical protein